MADRKGLRMRRAERFELVLPVRMRIDDVHASKVRFGPKAGAKDGWIDGDVVDLGRGGIGLIVPHFVPRATVVRLCVSRPEQQGGGELFTARCVVQRVMMTDRRPAYMLGTSLVGGVEASSGLVALLDDLESDRVVLPGDAASGAA